MYLPFGIDCVNEKQLHRLPSDCLSFPLRLHHNYRLLLWNHSDSSVSWLKRAFVLLLLPKPRSLLWGPHHCRHVQLRSYKQLALCARATAVGCFWYCPRVTILLNIFFFNFKTIFINVITFALFENNAMANLSLLLLMFSKAHNAQMQHFNIVPSLMNYVHYIFLLISLLQITLLQCLPLWSSSFGPHCLLLFQESHLPLNVGHIIEIKGPLHMWVAGPGRCLWLINSREHRDVNAREQF